MPRRTEENDKLLATMNFGYDLSAKQVGTLQIKMNLSGETFNRFHKS